MCKIREYSKLIAPSSIVYKEVKCEYVAFLFEMAKFVFGEFLEFCDSNKRTYRSDVYYKQ